ncbi:Uncharacterized protein conserved in bacteria [Dermatophilus congolensis]|uniref:Uncharacterized protein conserved in bacteria n=1 Tax=Dermatophilus congolensis TaxID=1863 RepID=A0AA46BL59_9MICO|nr:hypothetical protein [Dermatophilus congolensis]STD03201.1 Uncharacterized protein conserved in bacteria [Dermatophilus congolensis]
MALTALKIINNWNELALFFVLTTAITAALLVIAIVALSVGVHLATARSIRNNLAGRTDTIPALIALGLLNLVTAIIVIGILVSITLISTKVQRFTQELPHTTQGITYMTLSGSTNDEKNAKQVDAALGAQLRKADIEGNVLANIGIYRDPQPVSLPDGAANILTVNSTYLKRYPELLSSTGPIPSTDNALNAYIPTDRQAQTKAIIEEVKNRFSVDIELQKISLPPIRTQTIKSTTWPLVVDVDGLNTKTGIKDPIVILLADGLAPISDINLSAALSKSEIMFTSREAAEKVANDENLTTHVYSIVDANQARIEAREKATQDLAQQTVTFILGIIILIISSTALAALWVQSRRQRLFAEWVTGHSWLRRHSIAVFGYTLLTIAAVTAWSIFITPSTSESLPPGEADRLALLGWAGMLGCAIAIAVFITSLAITTARTDHRQEGHA